MMKKLFMLVCLIIASCLDAAGIRAIVVKKENAGHMSTGIIIGDCHVHESPDEARAEHDQIHDLFRPYLEQGRGALLVEVPNEPQGSAIYRMLFNFEYVLKNVLHRKIPMQSVKDDEAGLIAKNILTVIDEQFNEGAIGSFDTLLIHQFNTGPHTAIHGIDERSMFALVQNIKYMVACILLYQPATNDTSLVHFIQSATLSNKDMFDCLNAMVHQCLDDLRFLYVHYGPERAQQYGITPLYEKLAHYLSELSHVRTLYPDDASFLKTLVSEVERKVRALEGHAFDFASLLNPAEGNLVGFLAAYDGAALDVGDTPTLLEWRAMAHLLQHEPSIEVFGIVAGAAHGQNLARLLAQEGYEVVYDSGFMVDTGERLANLTEWQQFSSSHDDMTLNLFDAADYERLRQYLPFPIQTPLHLAVSRPVAVDRGMYMGSFSAPQISSLRTQ